MGTPHTQPGAARREEDRGWVVGGDAGSLWGWHEPDRPWPPPRERNGREGKKEREGEQQERERGGKVKKTWGVQKGRDTGVRGIFTDGP